MKKQKILALCLSLALLLGCWPALATGATQTATVHGGWLILRETPSFSGKIRSSYPEGTVVTVTGQQGAWYSVIAPDGLTGYMLGSYLTLSTPGGGTTPGTGTVGTKAWITSANGLNVRLRSGPGTGYSILAAYAPGTECVILSTGSSWSRIRVGTLTGYMMSQFLTTSYSPAAPVTPVTPTASYDIWVISANGKGVNLRSGPGKSYGSIGFYSVGTAGSMITPGPVWSYVQIGSRTGYMMSQFLTTTAPTGVTPKTGVPVVISGNGRYVNLRSGPGKGFGVIKSFPAGTELAILTRGAQWYYVKIAGYYGYMMKEFIYDPADGSGTPIPTGVGGTGEILSPTGTSAPEEALSVPMPGFEDVATSTDLH